MLHTKWDFLLIFLLLIGYWLILFWSSAWAFSPTSSGFEWSELCEALLKIEKYKGNWTLRIHDIIQTLSILYIHEMHTTGLKLNVNILNNMYSTVHWPEERLRMVWWKVPTNVARLVLRGKDEGGGDHGGGDVVGLVQVGVEWVCELRTDFYVNIWDYEFDGVTRGPGSTIEKMHQ